VSETQLDSAATGATEPDAETGEADDVTDYSEEADGLTPRTRRPASRPSLTRPRRRPTRPRPRPMRRRPRPTARPRKTRLLTARRRNRRTACLRSSPVSSGCSRRLVRGALYAGYENRVKTNLESRIQSLNMEDFIYQIESPFIW